MSSPNSYLEPRPAGGASVWSFAAWRARWPSWLRHPPSRESLLFVLPAVAAALIALYLAMLWQIESPYWAAGTVMIVAQPIRAQVLQKSAARLVGTLLGVSAGVLMIQLGESAPEWFVAMLALWAGACTGYATLLRGFRSYGAVLAGYSALLVATASWNHPSQVFDIATARAAAVGLGVICYGVANAVFAPAMAVAGLRRRLLENALYLSKALAAELRGEPSQEPSPTLLRDLAELDVWVQRAASERPALRRRLGRLHGAVGGLLAMVSALEVLTRQHRPNYEKNHIATDPSLAEAASHALELFETANVADPTAWRRQARTASSAVHGARPQNLFQRAWLDHLATAIDGLDNALLGLQLLDGDAPDELPGGTLAFHRDWNGAWLNGARSAAAICFAGWLWFATSWPDGGNAMMMAGILAGLYSGRPNPTAAGKRFLVSVGLACVAGLLLKFAVLSMIEGFPELALLLAPFLLLGASAILDPRSADYSAAFNFLFLSQMGVNNRMSYDGTAYLNSSLSSLLGTAVAIIMFALLRPSSGATRARRMRSVIKKELAELGTMRRPPSRIAWESRMYDRLAQLAPFLSESERAHMFGWLDSGLQLLRLRRLIEMRALPDSVLPALQQVLQQPADASRRKAAVAALSTDPNDSADPAWLSARLALWALDRAYEKPPGWR